MKRLSAFRLKDRSFFPLAFALGLAMVALAFSPALGRLPEGPVAGDGSQYNRITIEGAYLNKLYTAGDAKVRLERGGNGPTAAYIEVAAGALADAPELGPHFRLAADIEQQFSGKRVRCTVTVKPAQDRGATQMMVNYSAGRVGESGWKVFDLQPGATDFSFEFDVPTHVGDQGFDYFAVRPVVPEKVRALLVEKIVFERL